MDLLCSDIGEQCLHTADHRYQGAPFQISPDNFKHFCGHFDIIIWCVLFVVLYSDTNNSLASNIGNSGSHHEPAMTAVPLHSHMILMFNPFLIALLLLLLLSFILAAP